MPSQIWLYIITFFIYLNKKFCTYVDNVLSGLTIDISVSQIIESINI